MTHILARLHLKLINFMSWIKTESRLNLHKILVFNFLAMFLFLLDRQHLSHCETTRTIHSGQTVFPWGHALVKSQERHMLCCYDRVHSAQFLLTW